jgi:hypothetical protein
MAGHWTAVSGGRRGAEARDALDDQPPRSFSSLRIGVEQVTPIVRYVNPSVVEEWAEPTEIEEA